MGGETNRDLEIQSPWSKELVEMLNRKKFFLRVTQLPIRPTCVCVCVCGGVGG